MLSHKRTFPLPQSLLLLSSFSSSHSALPALHTSLLYGHEVYSSLRIPNHNGPPVLGPNRLIESACVWGGGLEEVRVRGECICDKGKVGGSEGGRRCGRGKDGRKCISEKRTKGRRECITRRTIQQHLRHVYPYRHRMKSSPVPPPCSPHPAPSGPGHPPGTAPRGP